MQQQTDSARLADPVIRAEGLNKYYGGLRALCDIDIEVRRGEILALVGDNGAGKSTLIKALSGALVPDEGEIWLEEERVDFRTPHDATEAGIETVHQSLGLVDELNVPQNVFLGREIVRRSFGILPLLDKVEMRRRTTELMQKFGIGLPTLNEPVRSLSGGQRQVVAISRLLLGEPRLLIMDEPMAALGVDEGSKVLDLVVQLRKRGMSILMISHNLEHVFSIADRIAVMKNGRMVEIVSTSQVNREDVVAMITVGQRTDRSI